MSSQPKPVVVVFSILAGAQVILGGAALGEVVPAKWIGLAALVVAGVQVGMTFYVQGKVTPYENVAARVTPDGSLIAGPAAPGVTKEGEIVDVLRPAPRTW
jgi:hypothetical protein